MRSPPDRIATKYGEAMYGKLGATVTFLVTTLWAQNAVALCIFGFCIGGGGGGGGGNPVPELDATGALAVFGLLGALVAIVYHRARG